MALVAFFGATGRDLMKRSRQPHKGRYSCRWGALAVSLSGPRGFQDQSAAIFWPGSSEGGPYSTPQPEL
jgi:hypothetical protein